MLIIGSRQKNDSFILGNRIVTLIEIRGDEVDLEIKSPRESVMVSCKINESRVLVDNSTMTVIEIRQGAHVRFGIEAPANDQS